MFGRQEIERAGLGEVVRQMSAAAFIVEAPSGEIVLVNEQARQMIELELGRPMPSELGSIRDLYDSGDFEMLDPDGRSYELEEWPLMRSIGFGEEVRDEIADFLVGSTRIPVRCNSSPVYDEGRIVAGVVVFYDITEQKRAEDQLREANRRTEDILESISDTFLGLDREWRFTYINEPALRSIQAVKGDYELTREEVLGMNVWEVFPEYVGSVFDQKYHEAMREQKSVEVEAYSTFTDRWVEVRTYPSEEGLSVYYQDISERKRNEEQLSYHAHLLENM